MLPIGANIESLGKIHSGMWIIFNGGGGGGLKIGICGFLLPLEEAVHFASELKSPFTKSAFFPRVAISSMIFGD